MEVRAFRRLLLFLARSLGRATPWDVFEPNATWALSRYPCPCPAAALDLRTNGGGDAHPGAPQLKGSRADGSEKRLSEEGGEPEQTKALLRLLIKELRVNGKSEILPTYRVVTPEVCATRSSVGAPGIEPGTSRV